MKSFVLACSLLAALVAPSVASAQSAWHTHSYVDTTVDFTAVHATSPGAFWASGTKVDNSTFVVQYADGQFGDEVQTSSLVFRFYEEGGVLYGLGSEVFRNDGLDWVAEPTFWESVPDMLGGEATTFQGFSVDADGRLFVTVYRASQPLALLRNNGGYDDLCAPIPAYWADGRIVDGRGRYLSRTASPCMWLTSLPSENWEYEAFAEDEITASGSLVHIRNVNGTVIATQGSSVYTRAGGSWTETVPAFSRNIGYIAGQSGDVYISGLGAESSTVVYDDGQETQTSSPDGGAPLRFGINHVHWSSDRFVVAVGDNGGYLLRAATDQPPNADFEVTVAGADVSDLSPEGGADAEAAFRIDVDNLGDALEVLTFELTTSPPARIVTDLEHFGGIFDNICTEVSMGVYTCEANTAEGAIPSQTLENFYVGLALYQGPVEYFNTVELTARVTGTAGTSTAEDEASARYVFDDNPEYTGGNGGGGDAGGTPDAGENNPSTDDGKSDSGGCGNSTITGQGGSIPPLLLALVAGALTRRRRSR